MSFNFYNSVDTKSWSYQKNCLTGPIQSSAIGAILFSALDAFQGVPIREVIKPQKLGTFFKLSIDQEEGEVTGSALGVWNSPRGRGMIVINVVDVLTVDGLFRRASSTSGEGGGAWVCYVMLYYVILCYIMLYYVDKVTHITSFIE
jgi:hypothetical protein